jgi:hypothetical protein
MTDELVKHSEVLLSGLIVFSRMLALQVLALLR